MKKLRKKVFAAAGHTTLFMGSGRPEFDPKKLPSLESYLKETAQGTLAQLHSGKVEEGIIANFMSGRFLSQGNLPGFLPFMVPELSGKPCTAVEGACGSGGRAIAMGVRSILSDSADTVFVAGFEMQNSVKAVYGADVLAGAAYYNRQRKGGEAYFFPGLFSERAGAYYDRYGYENARKAMARWYDTAIKNARLNPLAQEYYNKLPDPFSSALIKPDPDRFVPHLNLYDCSKVTDGAASIVLLSEEGLKKMGLEPAEAVEIIAVGEAQADITLPPEELTVLSTTRRAVEEALQAARLSIQEIGLLELHDCFSITALLAFEAIGAALPGGGAAYILEGNSSSKGLLPTNLSGGLSGFGHPTGASGVRQLVDLYKQFTGKAANQGEIKKPFGLLISMGGNDKTVTAVIVKAAIPAGS